MDDSSTTVLVLSPAAETRTSKLRVNLFSPGRLRTRMRAEAMPGEDPMTLKPPEAVSPDIVRMLSPDYDETGVTFEFQSRETVRQPAP